MSVRYAPFYCEENVYWLVRDAYAAHDGRPGDDGRRAAAAPPDGIVVFVSNPRRTVALAAQRAGAPPAGLVVWDYHVLYVAGGMVYDPDTLLGYPVTRERYVGATFDPRLRIELEEAIGAPGGSLEPRFSLVPAAEYLRVFSSDRSHMRDAAGRFTHPPPQWPPVWREELGFTLDALVDGTHPAVAACGPELP